MCGKEEKCIQVTGGKPEGKKPLGRPRCRWEDDIKTDFKQARYEGVGQFYLV
jgi:hypothetical protein